MVSSTHLACFLCSLLTPILFPSPKPYGYLFAVYSELRTKADSFLQLQGTYAYGLLVEISLASKIQSQTYSAKGLSLS